MEISNVERPSYLTDRALAPKGLERMREFIRPPRIKIVQSLTKPPVKPPYDEGDVVITPMLIKIGDLETCFTFTPLFFYDSYICFNPIKASQLPSLRSSSLDSTSELAAKCKAYPQLRDERCPEMPSEYLKYKTVLNFLVMLQDIADAPVTPCILSFLSGEYKTGAALVSSITSMGEDIFALKYRAIAAVHVGGGNSWFGLDVTYHPSRFVTAEQYRLFDKLHDTLKAAHEANLIIGDESIADEASF